MINLVLKWGVLLTIWKKYGGVIKVLPVIVFFVFIIYAIHGDYIEYAEVSDNKEYIAWSFFVKWLLIAFIFIVYWYYIKSTLSVSKKSTLKSRLEKTKKSRHIDTEMENKKTNQGEQKAPDPEGVETPDPFSNIRRKKHLRSKADLIIEHANNKNEPVK